jgi:hypothetical protein
VTVSWRDFQHVWVASSPSRPSPSPKAHTVGSILAIVFGKIGMNKADQGLATNRGAAKAGFVPGIVGISLTVVGIIIAIIAVGIGAANQ